MSELKHLKETKGDRIFTFVNTALLIGALMVVAYPLYFVIIASISEPSLVYRGQVWAFPKGVSWEGYSRILAHNDLWIGYRNTILYTVSGTLLNLTLTLTAGYALSRKDLLGRNWIMGFIVFTMFFSGGMIPTYLLIRSLNMVNTFWVMIIPGAVGVWNVIIARTFFQSTIPDELLEAAIIDGCSNAKFFRSIVLPLSMAIIAVLTIYYAVGHWNQFFRALIYLRDRNRFPLQLFLREILIESRFTDDMTLDDPSAQRVQMMAESMKYGVIIVASIPVLCLYPFLQKYFMKGVMIGSIKG